MPLLVTSASGANGNGFGALLAFESDGRLRGTFIDDDRIVDPRGLAVDPKEKLLFLNSGSDRVLAISSQGSVVRDTGRIEGLNPGGSEGESERARVSALVVLADIFSLRARCMQDLRMGVGWTEEEALEFFKTGIVPDRIAQITGVVPVKTSLDL